MHRHPLVPFPFCSVRIQYSGAPGSLQAQVSSIESRGNLVVDSHVQNEGNGWAGSGANPWHLDDDTESILFLTNESDKTAGIGLSVTANNVYYYLTDLRLNPHETRVIDLRKLRDAQVPDFKKNLIPANATDGSVEWIRLDNVAVMGRLMVINRRQGMASNYDCCTCPCSLDYSLEALVMSPASASVAVNGQTSFNVTATTENCNGSFKFFNVTSSAIWSSSDTSVATVGSGGIVTGQGGGTATISADFYGCLDWETNIDNECECELDGSPGPASGQVNVQTPTSLSIVAGTSSTTSEAKCTTSGGLSGCGVTRTFTYQVNDQNGQPINAANMAVGDVICNTSTNQLNLQSYKTTCGGMTGSCWGTSGPCGKFTDANGRFPESLSVCAPACISSGTCCTAGKTIANQTWTVDGYTLSTDVKSITYQCNGVLVNGK